MAFVFFSYIYNFNNNIMEASVEELAEVKGIQKFKSKSIKNGLNRLKITVLLER